MRRYIRQHIATDVSSYNSLDRLVEVWFGVFVSKVTIPLTQTQLSSQLQNELYVFEQGNTFNRV